MNVRIPLLMYVGTFLSFQEIQAIIHLWASEVTNFSSQHNSGSYSAKQVLGKPNVYPRYGGFPGTWTQPKNQLDRVHFLEVVNIYETYNGGAVVKISAKNEQNQWVDIYSVKHAHLIRKARKFSPQIKIMFPVNELRIEVDCSVARDYVEIDAIGIVGEISYFVGGRNINRRKQGGDWRWIKHGTMTKMQYFAFGAGEPNGTDQSPEDCFMFNAGDGYKFHNAKCGKKLAGYICEIEIACLKSELK